MHFCIPATQIDLNIAFLIYSYWHPNAKWIEPTQKCVSIIAVLYCNRAPRFLKGVASLVASLIIFTKGLYVGRL